jgi:phosphatidylglycerol:prolipoprotein diacylglycerol transferase
MFPDLLSIGPLTIHTYGLFVATGFFLGLLVTLKLGKSQNIGAPRILDMGFIMILAAIIGSRGMYVIMNLPYYIEHTTDIFRIWRGGLVFSGGILLVIPSLWWYARRHQLGLMSLADLWSPAASLGQGIGRIGCFMAGCCYGKATELPWGVTFTHPNTLAPVETPLHPTQIYAAIGGFTIFGILLWLQARKRFAGQVFLWFLILHSLARLVVERFRGDDRGFLLDGNMSVTQFVTLLILVSSVLVLLYLKSRLKPPLKTEGR